MNNVNNKKWKPGQLLTLNGALYRVRITATMHKHVTCKICWTINSRPPCIEMFDYPNDNMNFSQKICKSKMYDNCIPKRVK